MKAFRITAPIANITGILISGLAIIGLMVVILPIPAFFIVLCCFPNLLPESFNTVWDGVAPKSATISPDGRYVYVGIGNDFTNNSLAIVSTATNKVIGEIPVKIDPDGGLAINPDGHHAYATGGINGLLVVDIPTKTTSIIPTGAPSYDVAVSPDGRRVYVLNGNNDDALDEGSVSVIDIATKTIIRTIATKGWPRGLAVSPDGRSVYVIISNPRGASGGNPNDSVTIIDSANTGIASVTVGSYSYGIAMSPDGQHVYVANEGGQSVFINPFNYAGNGSISVINTANKTITATIPTRAWSDAVTVSPDSHRLYVTNRGGIVNPVQHWGVTGTVSVIDTLAHTVTATFVFGGDGPHRVAISPDGRLIYVAVEDCNSMSVIDASTGNTIADISLGRKSLHREILDFIDPDPTVLLQGVRWC